MFDVNLVVNATGFPLDLGGSLVTNPNMYPRLVDLPENGGFRWRRVSFIDTEIRNSGKINPNLYGGIVKVTTEVVRTDI